MNTIVINTAYYAPPVPTRIWDWTATYDSYDAGDAVGFGRTEQEAIISLVQLQEPA